MARDYRWIDVLLLYATAFFGWVFLWTVPFQPAIAIDSPDMAVPVTTGFTNVSAPESFLHADPNDRFAVRDTVVAKDRAGEVVIIQLPDFVAGSLVERYQMVRTPPLSWLSGRSFFWRTTTGEIGVHDLLFRAVLVDGRQEQLLIEVSLLPTRTN